MEIEKKRCPSCQQKKPTIACGICQAVVCKRCIQQMEEDAFAFAEAVPDALKHRAYCGPCFVTQVAPALDEYRGTLARARAVYVFLKSKGEETRLMKRSEKPLKVAECKDAEETILRLGFLAAKAGFNAIVDVDVTSRQVRNFGYQSSRFQGTGVPVRVDAEKLEREQARKRFLPMYTDLTNPPSR